MGEEQQSREPSSIKVILVGEHEDWVQSVCLDAQAKTCVSSSMDKTVKVWDLKGGPNKAHASNFVFGVRVGL